jgi:hypothetical protein
MLAKPKLWRRVLAFRQFCFCNGFLSQIELTHTAFRSDHVSNRLVLKGTLNADKARLLAKIRLAMEQPDAAQLRPAWATGL